MPNQSETLVLQRVLTSGVLMSIERSEKELPNLQKTLSKHMLREYVSLFNSRTAALHGAFIANKIQHGSRYPITSLSESDQKFAKWLGIKETKTGPLFSEAIINCQEKNITFFKEKDVIFIDFGCLGYGPAGAVLTNDYQAFVRCEKLKIFGSYDLRTMWTQQSQDKEGVTGVQFNYRLSPLVAACIRQELISYKFQEKEAVKNDF